MKHLKLTAYIIVAVVGVVAFALSFVHISTVALLVGEGVLSYGVPLTVDGLLLVGSVNVLLAQRQKQDAHWTTVTALVLGIAASLGLNVLSLFLPMLNGVAFNSVAAFVVAFPALALFLATEQVFRITRSVQAIEEAETVAEEPEHVLSANDQALMRIAENPRITAKELAEEFERSTSWAYARKREYRQARNADVTLFDVDAEVSS